MSKCGLDIFCTRIFQKVSHVKNKLPKENLKSNQVDGIVSANPGEGN
jgi:hypothetical protein